MMHFEPTSILSALFESLAREEVPYCVLRNYASLPEVILSKDIDMMIDHTRLKDVERILSEIAVANALEVRPMLRRHRYVLSGVAGEQFFYLPVDLHYDEESYGWIYLTGTHVLGRRRRFKNFYVPHPVDEAIICWFASYLSGGFVQGKYVDLIHAIIEDEETALHSALREILGNALADQLLAVAKAEGLQGTLRLRRKVFWHVVLRNAPRNPWRQFRATLRFSEAQLRRRLAPPGTMTAILGVDGSGKSTLVSGIVRKMKDALRIDHAYTQHWRPGLLPPLRDLFRPWRWRNRNTGVVNHPHSSEPSGRLGSCLRLLYYYADFTLGYLLVTRRILARGRFVFFDRYYYDYLLDQRRSRVALPLWLIRSSTPFVPRPNVILCLGADPEIIHARKPELPLEEVKRQVDALRKFCAGHRRAVWIDTGCSVEESVNLALTAILSHRER